MNSVLFLFLGFAQQVHVGGTYWDIDESLNYRLHSGSTPFTAFTDPSTKPTPAQIRILADRACVAWARVGAASTDRCRATGTSAYTIPTNDGLNSTDQIDGINFFADSGYVARAYCNHLEYFPGAPAANECDIGLNSNTQFTTYGLDKVNPGTALDKPWVIDGNGQIFNDPDLYRVLLHEIGHSLGLFHTTDPAIPGKEVSCPGGYPCPTMGAGSSSWLWKPGEDDWRGLRDWGEIREREIEYSIWNISSSGVPYIETPWTPLDNGLFTITTFSPPRIACRPDPGGGSDSCVMVRARPESEPVFYSLDVGASSVAVSNSVVGTRTGGLFVDVAFGDNGRYMGLGRRPVDGFNATRIVTYTGVVGSSVQPSSTTHANHLTHGEPRVTYHEPSCSFIGTWATRDGVPVVCSFDQNGTEIDCQRFDFDGADYDTRTVWATELICDNHLPGRVDECRLYVQPYTNDQDARNGRFISYTIPVNPGSDPYSCSDTTGLMGFLGTPIGPDQGTYISSGLVDAVAYGSGRESGQYNGTLYFVTEDRLVTSLAQDTIRLRLDDTGEFSPPDVSTVSSMDDTGAENLVNLTSWAWHEGISRFIAVRSANEF